MQTNRCSFIADGNAETSIVLWKTIWQYFYKAKHNFTVCLAFALLGTQAYLA